MGMELVLMDGRLGSSNNYGRGIFGIRLHGMGVMDGWMMGVYGRELVMLMRMQ